MIGKTGKDSVLRVATPGRLEGRTRCGRAHQEHREVLQHETGTESSGKDFGPRVRRNSKECKQILPPSSREHTGAEAGGRVCYSVTGSPARPARRPSPAPVSFTKCSRYVRHQCGARASCSARRRYRSKLRYFSSRSRLLTSMSSLGIGPRGGVRRLRGTAGRDWDVTPAPGPG